MTLERINTIPALRKLITPDVPVCEKCLIERLRLAGRNSDAARCPECIEKLTAKFTWVRCPCGEEYSYLGESRIDALNNSVQASFDVDYKRTSETSICIKCHNARLAEAWIKLREIMAEQSRNKTKSEYRDVTGDNNN